MAFIEKHKALILTSMLMGIFVLSLYNINMIQRNKEQAEIMMEIPEELLAKMEEEPEIQEELQEPENRDINESRRTHSAFNEDFEDHEDFEQKLKSLTETAEEPSQSETSEDLVAGEESIEEDIAEEIPETQPEEKAAEKEINNRNSSVTYTLKDRKKVDIPNPIYTCNGSGKVVVKILVNSNGYVTDAKIDKRKSNTRNECLFDNALQYAKDALFSDASLEKQQGTITYYFNYQG